MFFPPIDKEDYTRRIPLLQRLLPGSLNHMANTPRRPRTQRHGDSVYQVTDLAFNLAYLLWMVLMVLNASFFARLLQGFPYRATRYLCLGLLVLSELTNPHRNRRTIVGIGIFLVIVYAIRTSRESVLIDIAAFIYCGRTQDFRRIARTSIVLIGGLVALICFSSLLGIIQNYTAWSGGRMRAYLGFRYALFPAQFVYLITCLYIYLKQNRMEFEDLLFLLAINFAVYWFTDSRLSYYISVALVIVSWLLAVYQRAKPDRQKHDGKSFLGFLAISSFVLSAVLSVVLVSRYTPSIPWMSQLDGVQLLGGRLSIGHDALVAHPVTLFGRELHYSGAALDPWGVAGDSQNYNTIDCLYVRMLVNYGLVFTIAFVLLMSAVTRRAVRVGNTYLVLILVSIALRCTIDNLSLHLQYDTFLLLMGTLMNEGPVIPSRTQGGAHGQN